MFGKMKSGTADFVMAAGKKAGNLPKKKHEMKEGKAYEAKETKTLSNRHEVKETKMAHAGGKPRPRKP
jgi:hypothetical protein